MKTDIDPEILRELLSYDPLTGRLEWKIRPLKYFKSERDWRTWNAMYALRTCFLYKMKNGYLAGRIFDQNYLAHRVIWAWVHGKWPDGLIDHINRDRANNRIENLREATHSENGRNRESGKNATSRYLGVSWETRTSRWRAVIQVEGKHKEIGRFRCEVEAAKAYDKFATIHHGQFACLNFAEAAH